MKPTAKKRDLGSLESFNPATGDLVGVFPIATAKDVSETVDNARFAAQRWSAMSYRARGNTLRNWASILTREISQAAYLIHRETGKPVSDATLEVALAIEHISWAARYAPKILSKQSRPSGLLMFNMSAQVERLPYGVVGVIGPWNYPVFTPIGSIAYALAAGNTVIFKPSEFTPAIGAWLGESWKRIAPFSDIFTVVTGEAETGVALTQSGVDKISFTGSTRTAIKVAQSCASSMTPVVLECGGKDPVLIDFDADLKKAAEMTLWHAMSNAGQSCIGAERVYVHQFVAEKFTKLIVEMALELKPGSEPGSHYGPATMPSQLKVIKSHIDDAVKRGGEFLLGGTKSISGNFVSPVIIRNLPEDAKAILEETFGPTLVINTVASMDEAIEKANATSYGLGAAVWSKKHGRKIASRLNCGMVSINSAFSFAAIPSLPFGGVKASGYGRIHGAEGLLEFTFPRSIVKRRFRIPIEFTTFNRSALADRLLVRLITMMHRRKIR
jgi:aldehyde dehydrogenase (NAD+)